MEEEEKEEGDENSPPGLCTKTLSHLKKEENSFGIRPVNCCMQSMATMRQYFQET